MDKKVNIIEILVFYENNDAMDYHVVFKFIKSLKERPLSTIKEMIITCDVDNKYILVLKKQEGENKS